MSKVRIVSDGTTAGTRVLDSHGELIEGVTAVKVLGRIGLDQILAVIELDGVELDLSAEVVESLPKDA